MDDLVSLPSKLQGKKQQREEEGEEAGPVCWRKWTQRGLRQHKTMCSSKCGASLSRKPELLTRELIPQLGLTRNDNWGLGVTT